MKQLLILSLLLFSDIHTLFAEEPTFSAWMQPAEFDKFYSSKSNNEYPPVIQAKLLLGDGVAYRALFVPKPTKNFNYQSKYGLSESHFKTTITELKSNGFVLIYHQQVQLFGGLSHQATWVKK